MACANGHKEKIKQIAANRKVREEKKGKVVSEVDGDLAVTNSKSMKGSAKEEVKGVVEGHGDGIDASGRAGTDTRS